MEKINLTTTYIEFDSPGELPAEQQDLLQQARLAMKTSYSPYSKYKVGAAVLLENGRIFTGSNQENIAFPSGLCAERVAVFTAAAADPDTPIRAIAITSRSEEFPVKSPVSPCGACRQVLIEYEIRNKHKITLILMGETGKVRVIEGIDTILPMYFQEDGLSK